MIGCAYLKTEQLRYVIDKHGALYLKNISCKMNFLCLDCDSEHIKEINC